MKKILIHFCFFLYIQTAFSQNLPLQSIGEEIDVILQKIAAEKDENKRIDLIASIYTTRVEMNPNWVIETAQKLLEQSRKNKDIIGEASASSLFGQGYRLAGNSIKALNNHHRALATAEKTGNQSLLALVENQMGHIYKDREDNDKAISIYLLGLEHATKGKNNAILSALLWNLGAVYLAANKLDSALMYSQRAYELCLQINFKINLPYILSNLGSIQSKLGNTQLAIAYYDMAAKEALKIQSIRYLNLAYTGLAQHYYNFTQTDSSLVYAKKAIAVVDSTFFFYLSIKPAKLLTDIYENSNCDSTLKYAKIFKAANDTLYNTKANQQIQLMTFEEDLRQQELTAEKIKAEEQRKENIQYTLIAFGIITLLILYLLLSRSFITNTKIIEFFGVVALLIVFEFLNLLLHPFLERITYHSPVLMLLALVCIAAFLVPIHHKLEKWATGKLVEKNKQIRLAAAKKTIKQLGENP